jgi:hypothetical protein
LPASQGTYALAAYGNFHAVSSHCSLWWVEWLRHDQGHSTLYTISAA